MIIHGEQLEITDFKFEDFELVDYDPHPTIKAPISVRVYNWHPCITAAIVAVSQNGVIGKNGDLPWNLPGDLKWFRKLPWDRSFSWAGRLGNPYLEL